MASTQLTWGSFLRITSISVATYEFVTLSTISSPRFILIFGSPSSSWRTPQFPYHHTGGMEDLPFTRVHAIWVAFYRPPATEGAPLLTPLRF